MSANQITRTDIARYIGECMATKTNREMSVHPSFIALCTACGFADDWSYMVAPTKRQASKFRRGVGALRMYLA